MRRPAVRRSSSSAMLHGAALLTMASAAFAHDAGSLDPKAAERLAKKPAYSPYVGREYPTRPLFGDTHLHTSFSMDAGAFGARVGPRDAERLARGEEILASSGQPVRLSQHTV